MPPQYWLYGLAPWNHLYTLPSISSWPPEDGCICDPKHFGVNFTWTFNVFVINIELWVHELVIIETDNFTVNYNDSYRNKTILRISLSADYLLFVFRQLHSYACRYCDIQYLLNRIRCNWSCAWRLMQISYTFALFC